MGHVFMFQYLGRCQAVEQLAEVARPEMYKGRFRRKIIVLCKPRGFPHLSSSICFALWRHCSFDDFVGAGGGTLRARHCVARSIGLPDGSDRSRGSPANLAERAISSLSRLIFRKTSGGDALRPVDKIPSETLTKARKESQNPQDVKCFDSY
jgi:hypothetical protein